MPQRVTAFIESLPSDLKKTIMGAIGSFTAFMASFPLELVNKLLQMASLLVGIALASVTLYRSFRHTDLASIMDRQIELSKKQDLLFKRVGEIDDHGCTRHRETVRTLIHAREDEV